MKNTTHVKLQAIDEKLKRWQSRLTRAHNAIVKLNRQRKRITSPAFMAKVDAYEAKVAKQNLEPDPMAAHMMAAILEEKKDALDIPVALKRKPVDPSDLMRTDLDTTKVPGPKLLEDLLNPAAVMNRKRLERLDAKRRGYKLPKVDKTAMPLSGKAASEAIRKARKKD